jgi:kynurenine formamidase
MRSGGATILALAASMVPIASCMGVASDDAGTRTTTGLDLSRATFVDLTHAFDASTIYWPTSPTGFQLDTLSYGPTPGGWFYSSFTVATPEHGGTHLDAPIHFSATGETTERVPLERLITKAVVIDVTRQAAADPDYRLTPEDVTAWESEHGRIEAGTAVLLRTGWSSRWPDHKAYLGDDTPGDATHLHFPSYGEAAARLLVEERNVGALGADVASIDYGASADFIVHQVAMARNVPGFENLMNLDRVPETGAWIIALPMKIAGGSGGPLRAVAIIPQM